MGEIAMVRDGRREWRWRGLRALAALLWCIDAGSLRAEQIADSVSALFEIAAEARPGDRILLAESLTSTADPDLPVLTALRGSTGVTLVGYADFRKGAPPDVDYDARASLRYRDRDGQIRQSGPARPDHPFWAPPERWIDTVADVAAPPIDHRRVGGRWTSIGLRIAPDEARAGHPAIRLNGIAHAGIPHDGHLLWVAEYARADGSTFIAWEERDDTRARYPALPHRAQTESPSAATHLIRFATLMIASHDALPREPIDRTLDPRRWPLAAKKLRHAIVPDHRAETWDEAMRHLAGLAGEETIPGAAPGGAYIIELSPDIAGAGPLTVPEPVRKRLTQLRDNRVLLVGAPGLTILPGLTLNGVANLDFAWVTITPARADSLPRRALLSLEGGHVRFFGCVIDGFDGSPHGLHVGAGILEFHDGVIANVGNAIGIAHSAPRDPAATPRVLVARTLIEAANDGISKYGSGSMRIESNYFLGRGGAWNRGGFLHADLLGQFTDEAPGPVDHRLAIYHNILDAGPNADHVLAMRGSPNLTMIQGGRFAVMDLVGNILVQPTRGGGFQRLERPRRNAATAEEEENWFGYYHVGQNMLLTRPDEIRAPFAYPTVDWKGFGGAEAIDASSASDNLLSVLPAERRGAAATAAFSRTLSLFPEERAALPQRAAAEDVFTAFPKVSGSWLAGYRLDWSNTRHANSSREGYFSPADLSLRDDAVLRRRSGGEGRGLPFHGEFMTRFLDLPEDIRVHLGWTDEAGRPLSGAGYGADWFGGWRPPPFTLDAVYEDPWTPMPGASAVEPRMLIISTFLETLAEGALREESDRDAPLKVSRLRIERRGEAFFPVFEQTDEAGAIAYRASSAVPLEPGPLVVGLSTGFRGQWFRRSVSQQIARRLAYDHFEQAGDPRPIALILEASPSPPFAQVPEPVAGIAPIHLWLDTTAPAEPLLRWSEGGWTTLQGDLARLMSLVAMKPIEEAARAAGMPPPDLKSLAGLQPGAVPRFRQVWLMARSLADTPLDSLTALAEELGLSAGTGTARGRPPLASNLLVALDDPDHPTDGLDFFWTGEGWAPLRRGAFDHPGARAPMGEVAAYFRSNGRSSVLTADWIWPNRAPPSGSRTDSDGEGVGGESPLARGVLRLGRATADPYAGAVRWYEERRLHAVHRINGVQGPVEVPVSGVFHRFARAPLDPATGRRDHPLLPGRDDPTYGGIVWEVAPPGE